MTRRFSFTEFYSMWIQWVHLTQSCQSSISRPWQPCGLKKGAGGRSLWRFTQEIGIRKMQDHMLLDRGGDRGGDRDNRDKVEMFHELLINFCQADTLRWFDLKFLKDNIDRCRVANLIFSMTTKESRGGFMVVTFYHLSTVCSQKMVTGRCYLGMSTFPNLSPKRHLHSPLNIVKLRDTFPSIHDKISNSISNKKYFWKLIKFSCLNSV